MKKINETLLCLVIGILIPAIIFGIAAALFLSRSFVFGLLLGTAGAVLLAMHMYTTLNKALDGGEEFAKKYMTGMAFLRMFLTALVVCLAIFLPQIFHVAGVLAGLLLLKLSAYMQPFTHKYIVSKILSKGR